MALHGFTLSLAREGYRYNIYCNCVSPYVALNYDASIKDKSVQVVKPEFLSPLLVFLTHEKTRENGSHFEAGAGYIGKLRWERSQGSVFKAGETFTPGAVAAKWNEINDFNQSDYPTSALDNDWFRLLEKSVAMPSNNDSIGDLSFKGRVVIVTGAGGGMYIIIIIIIIIIKSIFKIIYIYILFIIYNLIYYYYFFFLSFNLYLIYIIINLI